MNPKLRQFEANLIEHNGQPAVLVRERLGLADRAIVIPQELTMLLALCDGTRDASALATAFELQTGLHLGTETVEHFLHQLDEALLLDSPRAASAKANALEEYRSAAYRPPSCAGGVYPDDANELRKMLDSYMAEVKPSERSHNGSVRGLVSPHIDYQRGAKTYAATWRQAQQTLTDIDVAVIFGTDHSGPDIYDPTTYIGGEITMTRQNYYTPLGVAPTAQDIVDQIANAIGPEAVFADELHHCSEHSIELALVWLQYFLGNRRCQIVPILCGSFQFFTEGLYDPAKHEPFQKLTETLRKALAGRKSIVIAAGDMAHVGPAFGDTHPCGAEEKKALAAADASLLQAAATGDANNFLLPLIEERDQRRICGLPPIYLTLKLLGGSTGELVDYAQCPADANNTSVVSICGMLFS